MMRCESVLCCYGKRTQEPGSSGPRFLSRIYNFRGEKNRILSAGAPPAGGAPAGAGLAPGGRRHGEVREQ
jgi:hypothetical protein